MRKKGTLFLKNVRFLNHRRWTRRLHSEARIGRES